MRRRRPDLLKVLLEPIETDRRGEVPSGWQTLFQHSGLQLSPRISVCDLSAPVYRVRPGGLLTLHL
jgi:hypothetical protein